MSFIQDRDFALVRVILEEFYIDKLLLILC